MLVSHSVRALFALISIICVSCITAGQITEFPEISIGNFEAELAEAKKINRETLLKFLIVAYLTSNGELDQKILHEAQAASPITKDEAKLLESFIRQGSWYNKQDSSVFYRRLTVNSETFNYYILVPRGYDPQRCWPVIISLHGAGGLLRSIPWDFDWWVEPANQAGFFIIHPFTNYENAFDFHSGGWTLGGAGVPLDLLREIRKYYNIDDRRIFCAGYSSGSQAAYEIAALFPDLFAGIVPVAGAFFVVASERLINLTRMSIYAFHGTADTIQTYDDHKRDVDKLKALGADVTFKPIKDAGHWFTMSYPGLMSQIIGWCDGKQRQEMPKEIRIKLGGYVISPPKSQEMGHFWWIHAKSELGSCSLHCVAHNRSSVEITCTGLKHVEVLLSDAILDLDNLIDVFVNGRKIFSGQIERSLATMLKILRETRDRDRIFWGIIPVEVQK